MITLSPYKGSKRQLVLGIDVGTTFSGMSYAVLVPGQVPKIDTIRRYPGQANAAQHCRTPSILYYRPDGKVHSWGAEAASPETRRDPAYKDLILVKWFKMHLIPEHLRNEEVRKHVSPLPLDKTIVNVLTDFLERLVDCAKNYINDTRPTNHESLWEEVKDSIQFVLTHPNGWEDRQQDQMRHAAIEAKLVPDISSSYKRIHFVTEGEAGLHYCLQRESIGDKVELDKGVMIVDAGGGTVDTSSYVFCSTSPLKVEEPTIPDCIVQGSTIVNTRVKGFLEERVGNHPNSERLIQKLMENFERDVKPHFSGTSTRGFYIETGREDVEDGELHLTYHEMLSFFSPSFEGIISSILAQFRSARGRAISSVFLIGGFSANEWLYENLKSALGKLGLRIYRPEESTGKAVSEGAIVYYLEHYVSSRKAPATYGTPVCIQVNPFDSEHHKRIDLAIPSMAGLHFEDGFSTLVNKDDPVSDGKEFSMDFCMTYHKSKDLKEITDEILKYTGSEKNPRWQSAEPEKFKRLCLVRADVSKLVGVPLNRMLGAHDMYKKPYRLTLRFGVEKTAQISWMENNEEKRGPAQLIFDEDDSR